MAEHELKTWPALFEAIKDGRKNFDVRKNDRGFQTGDILILRKWDPDYLPTILEGYKPSPRGYDTNEPDIRRRVTYVFSGFGIENGYVVMGLENE